MNEFAKTPFSNHKKGSPMHLLSTSIMSCGRLQQHVASPVTQMNSPYMLHDFIARVERSGGDIVVIVGGGGVVGIEPL